MFSNAVAGAEKGGAQMNKENKNLSENAAEESRTKSAASDAGSVSKKKFNARKFKRGTMSVVLTIVFIAVIVVFNVIVGILSERFDTSADLSSTGVYTIDEKTENFVKELDMDVTITVLNTEQNFEATDQVYKQVNEILKKMQLANERITIEYLDIDQNPAFTAREEFKGETLSENYIVVECSETGRHRIITSNEYITVNNYEEYYNAYMAYSYYGAPFDPYDYIVSNIEQEAVSAMMFAANNAPVRVAFTEGYEEQDSTALSQILSKNGYDVESINLTQVEKIDEDIDFVVMFAPKLDYAVSDLEKLDKFLDNGGAFGKNVVYFASASQQRTPNIEGFLNDWGMSVDYSVICQSDQNYVIPYANQITPFAHVQQISDTLYAGSTYNNGLYTYGALMRPVIQIWEGGARGGVEQEIIMTSYDGAYLYPIEEDASWDPNTVETGVYNDAIVAFRVHSTTQDISRLAVFGSENFMNAEYLQYSNANNGTFIVNMFNNICGRNEGITITPKSFAASGFDMTAQQANTLAVILCIVIPVVVIALGIVIWVRRRHR